MKAALSAEGPCSYLSDKNERVIIIQEEQLYSTSGYSVLLQHGFRRSGDTIYTPHCNDCQACQSIRVSASLFIPSKSQKRLLKKNTAFTIKTSPTIKPHYYALYERYINTLHHDGSMFPASREQYDSFVVAQWLTSTFIEIFDQDKLIAVAVTDTLNDSLSAMYTFYDPNYHSQSLGTFAILTQLQLAKEWNKSWLYLGYQVDACRKMNYKTRFKPYERFIAGSWHKGSE